MESKSLFIEFMGDSPMIKILDYLLTERHLDFSITDIAKNANISRSTLYRMWDAMIKNNILVPTRVVGKAKLYQLNKENPIIKKLIDIDDTLLVEDLKKRKSKK